MGKQLAIVILVVVGIAVLLCWMNKDTRNPLTEGYKPSTSSVSSFPGSSPYRSAANLDEYYEGSTKGVEDYLVDNMTCHPSCCGDQWPVPFDGLNSREVETCIETRGTPGPFVRTNYTCANGINGVGCPCINKKAYMMLVDHGKIPRPSELDEVEPTFLIRNKVASMNAPLSPYEEIQITKSMFSDERKLTDLKLQRPQTDLSNVQSYKSAIQPKYKQLERIY